MCTLVVARHVWKGAPLVVAANRDEMLARPAAPPLVWAEASTPFVAPRDLRAGGTWLGVRRGGPVAAITNRRWVERREGRASRGTLVVEALGHATAAAAACALGALDGDAFDGFHLVVADLDSAWLLVGDGATVRTIALEPGVHVVTEAGFDGATARERTVRARLETIAEPTAAALRPLLAIHAADPFDGTCNHADVAGYGTRSSSLVVLRPETTSMWHREGRPCEGELVDQAALLERLS